MTQPANNASSAGHASPAASDTPPFRYGSALADQIELRWQDQWSSRHAYKVLNPGEQGFDPAKPKYYVLDMFPYPSGAGLHVGHPLGYTATDILSRFKRMQGFNVLHPMGWDAFGLPAEQYAIQTGIHPAETTRKSIDTFRRQLSRFGFSYDWSREFGTIDPEYYRWTQWIFLKLYHAWFDPKTNKARPIADLVQLASQGQIATPAPWNQMSPSERDSFLDNHRLAYLSQQTVNWCPKLGTVLANDEVIDGRSERGGHPVLRKPLKQWVFRITAYADRLLQGLENIDWSESTKTTQREWIGKSQGAEIDFPLSISEKNPLRVFTTRPDTLFGATYMVVAPEHNLCQEILDGSIAVDATTRSALAAYVAQARNRSDVERQESKDKTGVFTGVHAINPVTNTKIPVWAADYVLTGYGTGAIMAVPAHDDRDWEFALKHGLEVRQVVVEAQSSPRDGHRLYTGHLQLDPKSWLGPGLSAGIEQDRVVYFEDSTKQPLRDLASLIGSASSVQSAIWAVPGSIVELPYIDSQFGKCFNSSSPSLSLDGLPTAEAKSKIIDWLESTNRGLRKTNFKLRDWVFSRQRYWGEPFPIVYDIHGKPYPVMDSALPVKLPDLADYAPVESDDPQPLLAKATAWMNTTAGQAGVDPALLAPETPVRRETNTMPGSAGSSWYAIRYTDPKNNARFASHEAESYWMKGGVDFYLGGSEHAVGHLLYSRFWHNVLFDLGELSSPEPFNKLYHQGMVTSFAYQRADKTLVAADLVHEIAEGQFVETATNQPVSTIVAKMSKSLKNVINPDDVIAEFGADTFRLYEMYMGPLDASKPWNPRDIVGCFRFLQRTWRLLVDEHTGQLRLAETPSTDAEKLLHRATAKVGHDIERLACNTAIAALIELVNALTTASQNAPVLSKTQVERLALILSPMVPHFAEELWRKLGHEDLIVHAPWPAVDQSLLRDSEVEIPVQIQGKIKARLMLSVDLKPAEVEAFVRADPKVIEALAGREPKKIIIVPGKMVNIVV
jgi:leucyl-tRNA synthetase